MGYAMPAQRTLHRRIETQVDETCFILIRVHEFGNLPDMTRKVPLPLLVTGTLIWVAGLSPTWAASDTLTSMPIQVLGSTLGSETSIPAPPPAKARLGVAGVFQPAPMPNQDFDPPPGIVGVARGPSLTPALFSHKEEFAGDGYASASDADHGLDHRRAPAAGLNWSVPVK